MLNLSTLLWVDDQYPADAALADCLGDRYLYSTNQIFFRVRNTSRSLGITYSAAADRLWRDYHSAPLLVLHDILASGVIPYKDNSATLRRVASRNPDLTLPASALLMQVGRNYLLHESCHCISDRLLPPAADEMRSDEQRFYFVFRAICCEAFANVVERLAQIYADASTHLLFLTLNSYVDYTAEQRALLKDCVSFFGLEAIFQFGYLAFLHANMRNDVLGEPSLAAFIHTVFGNRELTLPERAFLKTLAHNVFTLQRGFREETSVLFFRMFGCEKEYRQCQDLDLTAQAIAYLGIPDSASLLAKALFKNEAAPAFKQETGITIPG